MAPNRPSLLPLAKKAFHCFQRQTVSDWLGLRSDGELAAAFASYTAPSCDLPGRTE
jgi:hypothetical protein